MPENSAEKKNEWARWLGPRRSARTKFHVQSCSFAFTGTSSVPTHRCPRKGSTVDPVLKLVINMQNHIFMYIWIHLCNYRLLDTISPDSARKWALAKFSLRQLYRTWIEPASRDVSNLVRYAFCRRKLQKQVMGLWQNYSRSSIRIVPVVRYQ